MMTNIGHSMYEEMMARGEVMITITINRALNIIPFINISTTRNLVKSDAARLSIQTVLPNCRQILTRILFYVCV